MITYGYDDAITVSTEWNRYICLCLLQVLYVSHYVYAMNSILVYEYGALLIIYMLFEMILNALVIEDDIENVNKGELSYRYVKLRCICK